MPAQYPADVYNRDDETLLKFLQGGGAGRGPEVDKAIQDLLKQRGASGFAKQAYDFDPQRQNTSSAVDPLRDPGAYASTGFNTSQATKTQSAQANYFQDFLSSLSPEERSEIEGFGDLSEEDKKEIGYNYAAQQKLSITDSPFANYQKDRFGNYNIPTSDSLVSYDPNWGEYGGYVTKENLGFSPTSVLYKRYQDAANNIPLRYDDNTLQVGHRALYGTGPGGSDEGYQMVLANEADRQARSKAFEDLYKTPLSQIQYEKFSDAPSLQAFRDQFSSLGIDIPLMSDGGYFVRRATEQDPEVQQFGIYNVGRQDYRQTRINEGTQKNIELLKQQAEQGIQPSQEFLEEYIAEGGEGTQAEPQYGPRGENLGEVAVQYGDGFPKTPEWMKQLEREYNKTKGKPLSPGTPKPGRGMGDVWEGPVRDASAPKDTDYSIATALSGSDEQRQKQTFQAEYDPQKAQTAQAAAKAYKKSAATEDPFRSQAVFG